MVLTARQRNILHRWGKKNRAAFLVRFSCRILDKAIPTAGKESRNQYPGLLLEFSVCACVVRAAVDRNLSPFVYRRTMRAMIVTPLSPFLSFLLAFFSQFGGWMVLVHANKPLGRQTKIRDGFSQLLEDGLARRRVHHCNDHRSC